jgi:hypothetical protein
MLNCVAEREGFEPSVPVTQYARLAIWCLRPLGHLSARASARAIVQYRSLARKQIAEPAGGAQISADESRWRAAQRNRDAPKPRPLSKRDQQIGDQVVGRRVIRIVAIDLQRRPIVRDESALRQPLAI